MKDVLIIALVIVFWWIAVWGLVETLLHQYIKNSFWKAIGVYGILLVAVISFVTVYPQVLEHFF
jgi:hypothetical protein